MSNKMATKRELAAFFTMVTVSSEAYGCGPGSQRSSESPEPSEPGTESAALSSSGSSVSAAAHMCDRRALPSTLHSRAVVLAGLERLSLLAACPLCFRLPPGSRLFGLLLRKRLRGTTGRSRRCVLDLGTWITVHFLPFFPDIHHWGPGEGQGLTNTHQQHQQLTFHTKIKATTF